MYTYTIIGPLSLLTPMADMVAWTYMAITGTYGHTTLYPPYIHSNGRAYMAILTYMAISLCISPAFHSTIQQIR